MLKNLKMIPCCVTPQQHAALKALSMRTKVSIQDYLREAVTDVLDKHGAVEPAASPQPAPKPSYITEPPRSRRTSPRNQPTRERLLEEQMMALRANFYSAVKVEVDKRLPDEAKREIERARGMIEDAQRLERLWRYRANKCIAALRLFTENWRTLIGCLHPDHAEHLSVERQARMGKATDVVTRTRNLIEETDFKSW